jgi:hypothetical protein
VPVVVVVVDVDELSVLVSPVVVVLGVVVVLLVVVEVETLPLTFSGDGVASSSPPHPAAARPITARRVARPRAVRRIAPILYTRSNRARGTVVRQTEAGCDCSALSLKARNSSVIPRSCARMPT